MVRTTRGGARDTMHVRHGTQHQTAVDVKLAAVGRGGKKWGYTSHQGHIVCDAYSTIILLGE
jgi:hypothetical protein